MKLINFFIQIQEGIGSYEGDLEGLKISVHPNVSFNDRNIFDKIDDLVVIKKMVKYSNDITELETGERPFSFKIIYDVNFDPRHLENVTMMTKFVLRNQLNILMNSDKINLDSFKIKTINLIKKFNPKLDYSFINDKEIKHNRFISFKILDGVNFNLYYKNSLLIDLNDSERKFADIDSASHDLIFHSLFDHDSMNKFGFKSNNKKVKTEMKKYDVSDWLQEFRAVYFSQVFDDSDEHRYRVKNLTIDEKRKKILDLNLKNVLNKKESELLFDLKLDMTYYNKKIDLSFQKFMKTHLSNIAEFIAKKIGLTKDQSIYVTWGDFRKEVKDYKKLLKLLTEERFPSNKPVMGNEYSLNFYKLLIKGMSISNSFLEKSDSKIKNTDEKVDEILFKINRFVNNINRLTNKKYNNELLTIEKDNNKK
jgi:hypothetical protein